MAGNARDAPDHERRVNDFLQEGVDLMLAKYGEGSLHEHCGCAQGGGSLGREHGTAQGFDPIQRIEELTARLRALAEPALQQDQGTSEWFETAR